MIRQEIIPYIDGNKLVAPYKVAPGTLCASDNGPMFLSEYYVILAKMGLLTPQDKKDFESTINTCIGPEGLLNRVPVGQNSGQEGPDDYLGVLNACYQLKITSIPRKFLKCIFKYLGALNNVNPGKWTSQSCLARQLQLVAAIVGAAFPSKINPIHWIIRTLALPLFFVAAISIAISCIKEPIDQADPRRLSWHLLQVVSRLSLMCKLASFIWYKRLERDYKGAGMKGVAYVYYQHGHPFIQYWVD